jgi:hypothetical protein
MPLVRDDVFSTSTLVYVCLPPSEMSTEKALSAAKHILFSAESDCTPLTRKWLVLCTSSARPPVQVAYKGGD